MIGYKTHWYGKEIEGRYTDIFPSIVEYNTLNL